MDTYNGYKNKATWNIALWLGNDYGLYSAACDFMARYTGGQPYKAFIASMGMQQDRTPDRFAYAGKTVSYRELNAFMRELVSN